MKDRKIAEFGNGLLDQYAKNPIEEARKPSQKKPIKKILIPLGLVGVTAIASLLFVFLYPWNKDDGLTLLQRNALNAPKREFNSIHQELSVGFSNGIKTFSERFLTEKLKELDQDSEKLKKEGHNTVFSPLSVATETLLLAQAASTEKLKTSMEGLFDWEAGFDYLEGVKAMLSNLRVDYTGSDGAEAFADIANALFISRGLKGRLSPSFSETVTDSFSADFYQTSFPSYEFEQMYSDYLEERTHGMIHHQVPSDPQNEGGELGPVKIVNTVYSKSGWNLEIEYVPSTTPFYNIDGSLTETYTTLRGEYESDTVLQTEDYVLAAVPLIKGFQLRILLPNEVVNFNGLMNYVHGFLFPDENAYVKVNVNVSIPTFGVSGNMSVKDMMINLGVKISISAEEKLLKAMNGEEYQQDGDFGAMFDGKIGLSFGNIDHVCKLEVDKGGISGAAVTETNYTAKSSGAKSSLSTVSLQVDKPFLFSIDNEDKLPVYMGVLGYSKGNTL